MIVGRLLNSRTAKEGSESLRCIVVRRILSFNSFPGPKSAPRGRCTGLSTEEPKSEAKPQVSTESDCLPATVLEIEAVKLKLTEQ